MTIPVSSSRVDLSLLHPRFKARLDKFFQDPQIKGRVIVTSGCRTYAQQKWLHDRYKKGRGNLAANPDWQRPDGFFKGSFHMEQPDGYCYAVDFGLIGRSIKRGKLIILLNIMVYIPLFLVNGGIISPEMGMIGLKLKVE